MTDEPDASDEASSSAERSQSVDRSEGTESAQQAAESDGSKPPEPTETVKAVTTQPTSQAGQEPRAWTHPVPTPPTPMFSSFWPEPVKSHAPIALLAAVLGGAAAAIFLPLGRPGIGWPLLGAAITVGLFLVSRKAHRRFNLERACWSVAAVLLLTVCALRAAEWLAALCILTACVAGMLATAGGRSVRMIAMAAVAVPVAAFRALP